MLVFSGATVFSGDTVGLKKYSPVLKNSRNKTFFSMMNQPRWWFQIFFIFTLTWENDPI